MPGCYNKIGCQGYSLEFFWVVISLLFIFECWRLNKFEYLMTSNFGRKSRTGVWHMKLWWKCTAGTRAASSFDEEGTSPQNGLLKILPGKWKHSQGHLQCPLPPRLRVGLVPVVTIFRRSELLESLYLLFKWMAHSWETNMSSAGAYWTGETTSLFPDTIRTS